MSSMPTGRSKWPSPCHTVGKFAINNGKSLTPKDIFQAAEYGNVDFIQIFVDSSVDFNINQKGASEHTCITHGA